MVMRSPGAIGAPMLDMTVRLGGPVGVEQAPARRPPGHQVRRAGLAADDHVGEVVQAGRVDGGQRRRGDERVGDPLVREQPRQFGAAVHVGRRDHHGRARTEGQQVLEHRRVEARRREVQGPRRAVATE